ncbi:hypothetical protein [Kribbella pittospori]|uniref:hypothetical protein n=1 Tax=Kribbella pittospori TaxID=722689 RepID=UPI0013F43ED0|nr:hypothetical protein [Kribbella pittospori]
MTTDGWGVASHAGSRLLADLADATGLTPTPSHGFHHAVPCASLRMVVGPLGLLIVKGCYAVD